MSQPQNHSAYYYGISTLLSSWIMAVGSLALVLFASFFVDKLWLPAVVLALEFFLLARLNKERDDSNGGCNILLYLITRILLVIAFVMVAINLYYMKFIDPNEFLNGTANRRIPYITILVMAPIVSIMVLWAYLIRNRLSVCKICHSRYGTSSDRGFLGRVFSSESRYQLRILFYMSFGITIYTTWYYWKHYSNVNLNQTDKMFYLWIPLIIIFLSVFFLGRRYLKIFAFYRDNVVGDASEESNITLLRYLIVCDNYIYLRDPEHNPDILKVDAALTLKKDYHANFSDFEAKKDFCHAAEITPSSVELRYLYENVNLVAHSNIFHYLCKVQSRSVLNNSRLSGDWLNIFQLKSLRESGMLTPILVSEIDRLYTIAMARKTYDKYGNRLYAIKHYKPTFKLSDLATLDVDYNDPNWLIVARLNEDRPLFKLRQFFCKYFKGYEI